MKNFSVSQDVRKVKISRTMRYHFTVVKKLSLEEDIMTSFGRGCKNSELGTLLARTHNDQPQWNTVCRFLHRLNTEPQYDPVFLPLAIHKGLTVGPQKDFSIPSFFIAKLATTTKLQK